MAMHSHRKRLCISSTNPATQIERSLLNNQTRMDLSTETPELLLRWKINGNSGTLNRDSGANIVRRLLLSRRGGRLKRMKAAEWEMIRVAPNPKSDRIPSKPIHFFPVQHRRNRTYETIASCSKAFQLSFTQTPAKTGVSVSFCALSSSCSIRLRRSVDCIRQKIPARTL